MARVHIPYIPQTIGEIDDKLGSMMLNAPTFIDPTGFFATNVDTEFFALQEGLNTIRKKLGEDRNKKLVDMADLMRAHFEADPGGEGDDTRAGRALIYAMEDELRAASRRKAVG